MRRAILWLMIALLGVTPQANYCLSRATLVSQVSAGQLTWKTSAPAGWSTDNTMVSWTDFTTYVANTGSCVQPGGSATGLMSWSQMISCAQNHVASQQNENVSGNYHTITYSATFNSTTGRYTCFGPNGSDGYSGTPVTLPAGTVAPGSSTPLQLTLSSITFEGSTSLQVQLKDPSGIVRYSSGNITASPFSETFSSSGFAAGAWSWVITQTGGTDGACDSSNGVTNYGGTQVTWQGTASWFQ